MSITYAKIKKENSEHKVSHDPFQIWNFSKFSITLYAKNKKIK